MHENILVIVHPHLNADICNSICLYNMLGVHCSVAGGLGNALSQAQTLGIDTFQIFTKNQRQWKERTIDEEEGKSFRNHFDQSGVKIGFSHTTYLINLASDDEIHRQKSILALLSEVRRCEILGLSYTVLHPGSTKSGEEVGIQRIAEELRKIMAATSSSEVMILLENTAGQGFSIGGNFLNLCAECYRNRSLQQ
jgi:deoxyribonuclease-4